MPNVIRNLRQKTGLSQKDFNDPDRITVQKQITETHRIIFDNLELNLQ